MTVAENGILAEVSTSLPEHSFIDAVGGRIPNLHGVDPVVLFERFDCSADRWPTHPSNLAKGLVTAYDSVCGAPHVLH